MKKLMIKQDINFLEFPLWMQDDRGKQGLVWEDRSGFLYETASKAPIKSDIIFLY